MVCDYRTRSSESAWLHSLSATAPTYIWPWLVVVSVCFVSNNKLYGMCILPQQKQKNEKFVFKKASHSYLISQLSPLILYSGSPQIFWERERHHLYFMSNLPLYSRFIHSMFIYRHLRYSQCSPEWMFGTQTQLGNNCCLRSPPLPHCIT